MRSIIKIFAFFLTHENKLFYIYFKLFLNFTFKKIFKRRFTTLRTITISYKLY